MLELADIKNYLGETEMPEIWDAVKLLPYFDAVSFAGEFDLPYFDAE
jgi:hypothetical protein